MHTERKTTSARTWEPGGSVSRAYTGEAPDPVAPDGEGWRMVGAAANADRLFWFWERTMPDVIGNVGRRIVFENVTFGSVTEQALREWLRRIVEEDAFAGPSAG